MYTCQTICTKYREKGASLTGDKQAALSKEQGISKHKKPKEEASLDLKPHVALWKKLVINITINI